jgi:hypothetical protein
MVPAADDGYRGNYSYLSIDTTPDAVTGPGVALEKSSSLTPCTARSSVSLRLRLLRSRGHAITRVTVYVDGKLVLRRRGRALRGLAIPGLPGSGRHTIRVYEFIGKRLVRVSKRKVYGCAHRRA